MKFAKLLEKFREQHNMTKADLASKLEVSQGYIFLLESERRKAPPLDRCRKIADVLHLKEGETNLLLNAASEDRMRGHKQELEIIRGTMDALADPFK